ncbi:MAG: hypothetical protein KDC10_06130, partial [Calditrichaeota bacterium]|nr:hypothetical protein [Calditrichota bacterium]
VDDSGIETPRVSFGSEGWDRDVNELWPGCGEEFKIRERTTRLNALDYLDRNIYDSLAVSEQDFYSAYTDTIDDLGLLPNGQVWDPQDNNHVPLGVKVEMESHAWSYSYAQDFIVIDYKISNIGSKFLKNLYIGLYVDADVGHGDEAGQGRASDDFCGFRRTAIDTVSNQNILINTAYIADNDGRPASETSGTNFTCPDVTGTRILRAPNPQLQTTFNWWNSNASPDQDYGPAWTWWQDHPDARGDDMSWSLILGTPEADIHKYQVMSNGEFDPSMPACVVGQRPPAQVELDPVTGDTLLYREFDVVGGGVNPNGDDTRYLISWGPMGVFDYTDAGGNNIYRLNPGESFVMTVAYIAGQNLHDRSHPQPAVTSRIDTTVFDWTDFDFNAIWSQRVYDNEMYDTPIYDLDGDGFYETGDGWPGEDVGLDGLWAPAIGDTVKYWGRVVTLPSGLPAIYEGPDSLEGNGKLDEGFSSLWGEQVSEDDFLWTFLRNRGNLEMVEDSFLINAGPKFSQGLREDWYIGHFNNNGFLDAGDGIPDFQGPPPPPCPDMEVVTGDKWVELRWQRNSMSEAYVDPFSRVQDFEGYRIYAGNANFEADYTLLAEFDNVNYAYRDNSGALRTLPDPGPWGAQPFRDPVRGWERQPVGNNSGFGAIVHVEGEPDEEILTDINEDAWVEHGIAVWVDAPGDTTFWLDGSAVELTRNQAGYLSFTNADNENVVYTGDMYLDANRDRVWNMGDAYHVEFRYRLEGIQSLYPRFYAVTAYDFGDYQTGTEPLETAKSCNAIRQAPSGSPSREVRVVPNPYRFDQDYTTEQSFGNSQQGLAWENQDDGSSAYLPAQDRRIEFMNLPYQCLIRIFSLSGDLVQIVPHNVEGDHSRWNSDFSEAWDLNNRNFQQAASGLYYFSVEDKTPGNDGSIATGKFVILK